MKRSISVVLTAIVIMMSCFTCSAFAAEPEVEATTAILIDAHSGETIWEKNKDVQMPPASMTKMITAILAVEKLDMDTVVTVDEEVAATEGTGMGLKEGERLTVRQLLTATLVGSKNDGAVALAKAACGNVKDFVKLMNDKAEEIGCENTHFVNPSGLSDPDHLSTAADMALITREFMKYDQLREICGMKKYTVGKTNKSEARKIITTNRLLYDKAQKCDVGNRQVPCYYRYAIGTKTGFTQEAQGCLAATAVKDGTELITVVLHSSDINRFGDTQAMFNYGFKNTKTYDVFKPGEKVGEIKVKGSKFGKTPCVASYYVSANMEGNESRDRISTEIEYVDKAVVPLAKGTVVGTIKVYDGDKLISSTDVETARDAEEGVFGFIYTGHVAHPFQLVMVIILFLICLLALCVIGLRIKYRRQRAKRRKRREMME